MNLTTTDLILLAAAVGAFFYGKGHGWFGSSSGGTATAGYAGSGTPTPTPVANTNSNDVTNNIVSTAGNVAGKLIDAIFGTSS